MSCSTDHRDWSMCRRQEVTWALPGGGQEVTWALSGGKQDVIQALPVQSHPMVHEINAQFMVLRHLQWVLTSNALWHNSYVPLYYCCM